MEGLRQNQVTIVSRTRDSVTISIFGKQEIHKILAILPFNSDRKRMSILAQNSSGEVILYTKGADEVVMARLQPGNSGSMGALQAHVNQFSTETLRTLVIAQKSVNEEERDSFLKEFEQASLSVSNRQELIYEACEKIENQLLLVGCTAVEDSLQEEAPETIDFLKKAGIGFWLLTGDKRDTAISIGIACNILRRENDKWAF